MQRIPSLNGVASVDFPAPHIHCVPSLLGLAAGLSANNSLLSIVQFANHKHLGAELAIRVDQEGDTFNGLSGDAVEVQSPSCCRLYRDATFAHGSFYPNEKHGQENDRPDDVGQAGTGCGFAGASSIRLASR